MRNTFRLLTVLLLACLALTACGKREWPSPVKTEDRFRWRSAAVLRSGGCIIVDLEAAGAWQNIDTVKVMLEPVGNGPGDGCETCPFAPRLLRSFTPGDAAYRRDMNRIVLTVCDLDPQKTYRVQAVGFNVFASLDTVLSELMLAAPK